MQIVIDIPQEKYDAIKSNYNTFPAEMKEWGLEAIKNGIVLPKGHGRLIDADALKKDDEVTEWLSINPIRTGKMLNQFSKLFVKKIDDEPTIIEADKESEE